MEHPEDVECIYPHWLIGLNYSRIPGNSSPPQSDWLLTVIDPGYIHIIELKKPPMLNK